LSYISYALGALAPLLVQILFAGIGPLATALARGHAIKT